MRRALNSFIESIPSSGIRKFFDIVAEMNDPEVISLGVGEPDFDTPWHVREEGIYSLTRGKTFYSPNAGLKELRDELSLFLKKKYELSYDPKDEIIVTVGGSEAIDLCFRAMLDPGDEVIIPEPAFVSYKPCVRLAGGVPVVIDLKNEDDFKLRPEDLEAAITDKTKIVFLNYPNNPTGAVMEREDLEPIAEIIKKHDLFVVSDEIYSELNYTGRRHVSIASFPGMRERTVVVSGFSKTFAMTGWRLGYTAGPQLILEQMTKIHQFAIMAAPTTSQYAAVEAMNNGDDDVDLMRKSYNQRRRFVLQKFKDMGLSCFEPEGAFYTFPCIKEFGMSSDEFASRFLKEEKVAVVPGTAFGDCGEGFLRISYAYSIEELKEALGRLERFVNRLRER